ncbi:hypothetical protein FJQ98_16835 [Lysinibacillus agricola]|uniref:Uncharacterized protein n=1 Tax=Lysinibacillus agricola TaxID=2590012 RepID=A0ABX7ARN9_9BACI|nr:MULTISPECIES: hypothetical protein [Lysinibacillus]QQP10909.1 hypothetical protein FJQ98_16835 [Lysinibacillus agricola]
MSERPIVSWYEGTNTTATEVKTTVNYGTVDAFSDSPQKTYFIWNNRGGTKDCSKMEDVKFTTRDRNGGDGSSAGNIVEAVRDNWFRARVDSLNEQVFTPVGKGGVGTENPSGTKFLGTNGTTTNIHSSTASVWIKETKLTIDAYVKPTVDNGFIYKAVNAGETGATEPSWLTEEGKSVFDNGVEFVAIKIDKKPNAKEILGLANNTKADGSNANLAGGNFVQVTVFAKVPIDASAGKNTLLKRATFSYV